LFLLFIGLISGDVRGGSGLVHYGTSDEGQFYYDKDSLMYLPDGVVRVGRE